MNKFSPRQDKKDAQLLRPRNGDSAMVFGEHCASGFAGNRTKINQRLQAERQRAMETLQVPHPLMPPLQALNSPNGKANQSQKLNATDYVPYRGALNHIDISDLITDETIDIDSSGSFCVPRHSAAVSSDVGKENRISFEPSEITGRSTLNAPSRRPDLVSASARLSVCDILASSFAPKARNLCETLRTTGGGTSFIASEAASLPRTADMSRQTSFDVDSSGREFPFDGTKTSNQSCGVSDGEFAPGDLMDSKLLMDEISWAEKFAAIPSAAISEEARRKAENMNGGNGAPPAMSADSMSSTMDGRDATGCSVGAFFHMHSEDLRNIVGSQSPDKLRAPIALLDEDSTIADATITSTNGTVHTVEVVTPRVENKTYNKACHTFTPEKGKNAKRQDDYTRKDSGNASYLLSMSAIDRALSDLNRNSNDSGVGIFEQILSKARPPKVRNFFGDSIATTSCSAEVDTMRSAAPQSPCDVHKLDAALADLLLENKENLDPKLCDTASFTESLLNASDLKNRSSVGGTRLPLSPITLNGGNIPSPPKKDDAPKEEAEIDDWPLTPVRNENRDVRRTQSPRDLSPRREATPPSDAKTPINKAPPQEPTTSSTLTKQKSRTPEPHRKTPTPTVYDFSPLSSPSGSTGFRSPMLDSTTSSDRRFLTPGAVAKTSSSPVHSESGVSKYGGSNASAPIMRTCSAGSLARGAGGRSASRCSSTSEFSHRDGKQLPLKVTSLALSWGSHKLRTNVRKVLQVKNISEKRVMVRVEIQGPGFQIVGGRSNTLALQAQECISIVISFCPTVAGVACGQLSFYSPQSGATGAVSSTVPPPSLLDIPLFGYGGHASINAQEILKGPVGAAFLPLGDLCELPQPLQCRFRIYNKGPLLGFACISIDAAGVNLPPLAYAFEVQPSRLLIPPGEVATVHVTFCPKREDIRKIAKRITNVLTLATLRVVSGDEPNRQRMRRLLQKLPPERRSKLTVPSMAPLWTEFPQEEVLSELAALKEQPEVVLDLMALTKISEVALTLNNDNLDDSATDTTYLSFPDADETVLFRTICIAPSPVPQDLLEPVDEEEEVLGSWSVRPTALDFDFTTGDPVTFYVRNEFKSRQYFDIECNWPIMFKFKPREGYVEPEGGEVEVEVHAFETLERSPLPQDPVLITVHMENERLTIPVTVFPDS